MPRSRLAIGLAAPAIIVALAGLPAPAAAEGVIDVYGRLAKRDLPHAPLVPTRVPPELRPIQRTLGTAPSLRRSGYGLRLASDRPQAVIAMFGGDYASMHAARRDLLRRQGYSGRPTRVRGHSGLALRSKARGFGLVWREGGVVYWMGTGTPRKISLADLRSTAEGLDTLEHEWIGTGGDPDLGGGAVLLTTRRTVTGNIDWGANCTNPDGSAGSPHAGSLQLTLAPRSGDRFTLDLAGRDTGSLQWSGQITGTVAPDALSMTVHATGTFDGATCDTGESQFELKPPR
jgi:hypothetical protein